MGADKRVPHNQLELAKLLGLAARSRSILEVGSKYGGTLRLMAAAMGRGKIVSVDLPGDPIWGEPDTEVHLREAIEDFQKLGYDAHVFIGDSKDQQIIKSVSDLGPFDLVFIDGDHRYKGVSEDWKNYGPLGKLVVFHDIVPPGPQGRQELGVHKLWKEIEGDKEEFIAPGSSMGLGIVHR